MALAKELPIWVTPGVKQFTVKLGDTTTTDTRGSSATTYALEPTLWARNIVESAKTKKFFESAVAQYNVPDGTKDFIQPRLNKYFALAGMTDTTTEGGAVSFDDLNTVDGVRFTPSIHAYGIAISNQALRVNAVNLLNVARDVMTEFHARTVDDSIADTINAATDTTSSAKGSQLLFGGDASSNATLAAGDVFTPDLLADARERLMSTASKYWSGSSFLTSSEEKAPWFPEPSRPFIAFIAPEQESKLLKDSQFVNAAEYGSSEVLLNGEIGKFLGMKVVTTVNGPSATNWGSGSNLAGHSALVVKAQACAGLAWGLRARVNMFDFPSELEKRIILETSYASSTIHNDAVVIVRTLDT